ncbi:DUF4365 domain-containing protein [Iningainema sp. BLCCT55]|uniref:DUF4365 domain-containing protein n=1 Tax=Iningainema tapete BLCC-T55 TaxID=2748662 RepID=A0A8J6XC38_9CYAN|nr:DUF4365 domain-containing protein [Iningainema tapete BLCC-T55]
MRKKSIDPVILIIVIVPEETTNWISVDKEQQETLLKKCGYWVSLKGEKETQNKEKIRIKIPKENVLTPEALKGIMKESLDYRKRLLGLDLITEYTTERQTRENDTI